LSRSSPIHARVMRRPTPVELKDDKLDALKNKCLPPGFAERFDLFEHAFFQPRFVFQKK
jgi:hypothetical protein